MDDLTWDLLDHRWDRLKIWVQNIANKRGIESTLSIYQIIDMIKYLEKSDQVRDDTIVEELSKLA